MSFRDEIPPVKRRIEAAFSGVPYPGDDRIAPHPCMECEEIAAFYKGKHWKDIPLDAACARSDADLGMMKPAAFRRYLPVFLLASLEPADWNEGLTTRSDAMLGRTMMQLESMATNADAKGMTGEQLAAVGDFVRLVDDFIYFGREESVRRVRAFFPAPER